MFLDSILSFVGNVEPAGIQLQKVTIFLTIYSIAVVSLRTKIPGHNNEPYVIIETKL